VDPLDPLDPLNPLNALNLNINDDDGDDGDQDDDDEDDAPPQFYLTTFIPRDPWHQLSADEATEFLRNRVAQLNEAFVEDDEGVIWAYRYHIQERGREIDAVVLLWMIASDEALDTLESTLKRSDVNKYFDWSVIGGPQNNAPQDILGAFLGTLVTEKHADDDEDDDDIEDETEDADPDL
jgi:hypothetical protein